MQYSIGVLLNDFTPSALVLRQVETRAEKGNRKLNNILDLIRKETGSHRIPATPEVFRHQVLWKVCIQKRLPCC